MERVASSEYRVLTPESVEFVYELGGLGSRMLAALVDHIIILGLLLAVWLVGFFTACAAFILVGPIVGLALLGTFLTYFGYFAWFEWRWNGQTPGKRLLDLRVIDDRGMSIDLFQALVRNLLRVVDMMPPLLGLDFVAVGLYGLGGIAAFISPTNKRLGDWAAGTLVVRTRKHVLPAEIIAPNEKYNTLQQDASLRARIRSRLGLQERETLLQLCLRRNQLEIEARQSLFAEAASFLERRLETTREPFLSEEKFVQNIAAVALEERSLASPPRARSRR
jgi:uncharacterized RDD family membrane protein YckC